MAAFVPRTACLARRQFIKSGFVLGAAWLWVPGFARAANTPIANPTRSLRLCWTDKLHWDHVVKDNRHLGARPGKLIDEASADLANNTNYEVCSVPPLSLRKDSK